MITPQTKIRLIKCPLTLNNKNQLTFQNKEAQNNYFLSLPYYEVNDSYYQRKDDVLYYPEHIDKIINYNYCMYQNSNYTNKWFFAFITNMEYENDGTTKIYLATDVFQTWQFDLIWKQSFIEREMIDVQDDVPGANLLPEGLESGEFIVGGTASLSGLEAVNIIAYTGDTIPARAGGSVITNLNQGGFTVNGIASSVVFLIVENEFYTAVMNNLQTGNFSEYILTSFTVPKLAVEDFMTDDNKLENTLFPVWVLQNGQEYIQTKTRKNLVSTPNSFEGYVPRNQKLRTYPFLYLGFNPAFGTSKIYRYEDFENGTPIFDIISEVNPNPNVIFIPQNYRGSNGDSLSDLSSLAGYPTVSNRSDYFNSWLAENGNIVSLNMQQEQFNYEIGQVQNILGGAGSLVGSIASGDLLGGLEGVASTGLNMYKNTKNHDYYIKMQNAQIEKQKMLPDKVTMAGSNATLLGYGYIDNNIFTRYTIKRQFAERIDKFFDMYGYLTNTVKIPNLNNRTNWNYIKTIGANIIADIPENDLQIIKDIFDNGVTLWHNANTYLDYSQNNR